MTRQTLHSRRRSDSDIFADARRALDLRPSVPASIHVHVDHGVVTLTGTVQWPAERGEAEDAVRHVEGLQRLVNEIAVSQVPDAEGFGPPRRE
jgi:osmotically-inducible protein OsmY